MKRKLRKPLSWLLTVAMIFSLFCGMIPTASAATVTGSNNYVTVDYDNTGVSSNSTLMVQVFGIDGTTVETIEITDAALESQVVTINLTSAVSTTYDMEQVTISGSGTTQVPTLSSDSYSVRWMPTAYQDTSISVYLCNQFVSPEIENEINDPLNTIVYTIQEAQILKMLYNEEVGLENVDVSSIDVQARYVKNTALGNTNTFAYYNIAGNVLPYYEGYNELSGASSDSSPNNIRQLEITYDDLDGVKHEVIVSSGDLRYVGDGNRTYNIEARDDSEYIVAFYYEAGDEWDRWTLYDFLFVPAGTSVGVDQMPNDPDYTVGGVEINDHQFVSWDYGVRGGYPFRYTDTIQDDTVVYAQKVSSEGIGGTAFHVMNQTAVVDRVVEIYNAEHPENPIIGDIRITNIRINGDGTTTKNNSVNWNNEGYYSITNYTVNDGHVPFNAVESMTVFFTLPDGAEKNVGIQAGVNAGEFSVSRVKDVILEIHINEPPTAPTDSDLTDDPQDENDSAILGTNAVKVTCTNSEATHEKEKTYGLLSETYAEPKDEDVYWANDEEGIGAYYVKVTDIDPSEYVKKYNDVTPGHTLSDEEKTGTITLKLVDDQWTVDSGAPVEFKVTCENEGGDTYHTITVSVTNGTVSYGEQTGKTELSFPVENNKNATINLNANPDYVLDYAVLDDVDVSVLISTAGRYTFDNVTHNMKLTVVYAEDEKGTVDENGNETGDGIPDCRQVFIRYESADPALGTVNPAFQTVNLERDKDQNLVIPGPIALTGVAIAKEGARFVNWTQNDDLFADDANLTGWFLKLPVAGATYIFYANFAVDTTIPDIFTITVTVHNGTATYKEAPVEEKIQVYEGESPAITFTPDPGYEFDKATLNGADFPIPPDGTYTIKNVQEDYTIEVWCTNSEEPEDPLTPPTDLEQLLEGYIHIQCANNPDHETLNCGLLKDSYKVTGDGLGLQENSYVIQIDSDLYAKYYDQEKSLGNIHTASGPNLIALTWDDGIKWIVPEDGFTVKIFCDSEPETETPNLPDGGQILDALKKSIIVECVTLPETHAKQSYDLIPGEYELEKASLKNDNGTWTLEVTVYPDSYLKLFNGTYQTSEGHVLVNQNDGLAGGKAILTYVDDSWTCLPGDGVTFAVKCSDGEPAEGQPSAPEHSTLAELIQVEVWCENLDAQHEKQEMALFGGTYSGTMSDSAPYTYTVTIESAPYIINFDKEGSYGEGTHHLVRALNDTVTLVWKDNNWQFEEGKNGVVQFYVTCKDEPQQPETYTVTFDSDGGSDVPSQKVVSGSCATEPTAPTKEGFTFAGWYLGDEKYDFNTPVSGNITLVAKWTENEPVNPDPEPETYIITATSGSNGTVDPSGETEVKKGDNLTISITPNQGYAVDTITVDGVRYVNNGHGMLGVWDKFTFASVNANHDLYVTFARDRNGNGIPDKYEDHDWPDWPDWPDRPEWPDDPDDGDEDDRDDASDPTYAVYYYPGYGSGARDLDKRYEEDTEVEVLAFEDVDLTDREGYTFIGWSTQANADSVIYLPGDTFDMPSHDVYLYAQWLRDQIGPEDTGVANWLNTTDHIAYLTGYPNGAFGPNNSMTRAEVAQMFYALLNNKNVTITASFPDVPADAWYATAVNTLASLGMVSGDADGSFRPNDPITRAEFCVIALAFAYEPESYSCSFTDVSVNDWFYTYVAQAASYGWIGGYADGSFGPNDLITRAQVTTIVNNMLGREADRSYVNTHTDTLVQFYDLTRIHWAYYDIMEAVNEHEYTRTYGTEDWR